MFRRKADQPAPDQNGGLDDNGLLVVILTADLTNLGIYLSAYLEAPEVLDFVNKHTGEVLNAVAKHSNQPRAFCFRDV